MQRKIEQIFFDLDTIAFEFHVWLGYNVIRTFKRLI